MFALFFGTILGFVLRPITSAAVVMVSVVLAVTLRMATLQEALSFWANPTIWLVFVAFQFTIGFVKTGLGRRIAFWLTRAFGGKTLRLAYVLSLTDLILAPAMPSNAARAGGVMLPITKSLTLALGSRPGATNRTLGSFLALSAFYANCTTSAMFMTAMASNTLIAELAKKTLNIEISWGLWLLAGLVPGLLALLVIPLFLYKFYPPELRDTPEAKMIASRELAAMGAITPRELWMLGIFLFTVSLWATSTLTKLDVTYIGFVGMGLMLITGVIQWKDVLEEHTAWDIFMWLGGLIGLAGLLAKFGFITWFTLVVSAKLTGVPWGVAFVVVVAVYFYSHYAFAGLAPHVVLMYAAFAALAVAAGAPKYPVALSLACASSLCTTLTNYAASPATIFFGAGYVDQTTWWKFGFLVSVINLFIWVGVGSLWWKLIGLW
jgi:DASS family divalent anion:Na+ symporter